MTRSPFFSVVIPTLNEEVYLPRLLTDLVKQRERDFEVIVVDGGSTDATVGQTPKFKEKLPLRVISEKTGNVSRQRNTGARAARGTYLIFFDADVQIPPRYLEKVRQQIEKVGGDYFATWVRPDSHKIYDDVIASFLNYGMELSLLVEKPFVSGFQLVVTKASFTRVGGYREDVKHAEDYDLTLRLHQAGYQLKIFRQPRLTFSLRRYRTEGRLSVMRIHARAGLHIFTNGPITKDLFHYPMGGGWYKAFKKESLTDKGLRKANWYMKRLVKLFLE